MTRRPSRWSLPAALLIAAPVAAADPSAFDLAGPGLKATVTRGNATLPIDRVPNLAEGDRLTIAADLPADQRARYRLISAFLADATNPPPKRWIDEAETWKREDPALHLTVPKGARRLVLFLVPDTGGAEGTIADAVRGRPGEFVRAAQNLNQASLDRTRLDAFVAAIRGQEDRDPEHLRQVAPVLARSLSIKLNADCLAQVIEQQAACLLQNRDALVLPDIYNRSVASTLVGAPTDLALQLSYTREGGLGYYSPYIAVVRDIARVFGAFGNPQFRYLPALAGARDGGMALLLNAAPSFTKPKSAIVAAMPPVGEDTAPRLRGAAAGPLCGARPDLVLPVEGAPLVFATGYAHDMALRLTKADGGGVDVPVTARADRGGYVLAGPLPAGSYAPTARLHGRWGFDALDGPTFELGWPGGGWASATERLVVGRDDEVVLTGGAAACVAGVSMRTAAGERPLAWTATGGERIAVTFPLKDAKPGEVTLLIRRYGVTGPTTLTLRAYRPASRIDAVTWHMGDRVVAVAGQRLDEIAEVSFGGATFVPGALSREGDADRLAAEASRPPAGPAEGAMARLRLNDGRVLERPVTVLPPRPAGTLLSRTIEPAGEAAGLPLAAPADVLPDTARLTFSLRAGPGVRFAPGAAVEVRTADGRHAATLDGVRSPSPDILVATLDPRRLGGSAGGAIEFRVVQAGVAGYWRPLIRLVRLPRIEAVTCEVSACTLRGRDLFLVAGVSTDAGFAQGVTVPEGYTGTSIAVPAPVGGRLLLRLRDAPEAVFSLEVR